MCRRQVLNPDNWICDTASDSIFDKLVTSRDAQEISLKTTQFADVYRCWFCIEIARKDYCSTDSFLWQRSCQKHFWKRIERSWRKFKPLLKFKNNQSSVWRITVVREFKHCELWSWDGRLNFQFATADTVAGSQCFPECFSCVGCCHTVLWWLYTLEYWADEEKYSDKTASRFPPIYQSPDAKANSFYNSPARWDN